MIAENISIVKSKIYDACKRSGRNPEDVTLIAVSKTKPVSYIEEALTTDILDYGENKVQEICDKYDVLPQNINWHMIGHLQRNKVKYLVGKVSMIHSVDSIRLAKQIEEEYSKKEQIAKILIQVNVANEDTKFGVSVQDTENLVREVAQLSHIKICGLMTIAPYVDNPEKNRIHFANLRKLSVDIKQKNIDNVSMNELSMGMTGDYEVAIEEGATLVRVGTGIFGERYYG